MLTVLNILLLAIGALIAYWWANQGLFSSLLHLLSVIVAGAMALAIWEPLVTGLLITGGGFDDFAWGIGLIVPFCIFLLIFRVGFDKLVPANVTLPHWANLSFGGLLGAVTAVLTLGILIIGIGFVRQPPTFMGFKGWQRGANSGRVEEVNSLWVPFHRLTSDFFGMLSVGSFSSSRPLRQWSPELWKQATLFHDSHNPAPTKSGRVSLLGESAKVAEYYRGDVLGKDTLVVKMDFDKRAIDFGESMTITQSQIRLIGKASGGREAPVLYPSSFRQYSGLHRFDHRTHVVSSQGGQEEAEAYLIFGGPGGKVDPIPADFIPQFIQVRGTRFDLRAREPEPFTPVLVQYFTPRADLEAIAAGQVGGPIDQAISIDNDIRPIMIGTNTLPGSIKHINMYLSDGEADFTRGGIIPPRPLRIAGYFEPDNTRVVKVNVSRGSRANIWAVADQVPSDAIITLRDSTGAKYTPIGYIYEEGDGRIRVKLDPTRRVSTIDQLPQLPSAGPQSLWLLFYVTVDAEITGLTLGDVNIGSCSMRVPRQVK